MESPDLPWAGRYDGRLKTNPEEPPSGAAAFFLGYLRSKGVREGRLIDIGCGKGRNSILFAKNGFEVHAVDRSDDVLKDLDLHGVTPHCHSVTDTWLFEDGFFDIAMDIFCYCGEADPDHRRTYLSELMRVLKPGGYYLLCMPTDSFRRDDIVKEFRGFEILAIGEGDDRIHNKAVKTSEIILRHKG
jgi:SAM-dependent methyltransferase